MPAKRALVKVPDQLPIPIGKFTLTATGMLVDESKGEPSFDEYQGVGDFIKRAHQASGWWLADWLSYGESRREWAERLSQAQHVTGLSDKRLKNIREVAAINPSRRRETVEFHIHEEVCRLPPDEQEHWLEVAETDGLTRSELRMEITAAKRRRVIEGQATLEGQFRFITADPPLKYRQNRSWADGSHRPAESSYGSMTLQEICDLPVAAHALPVSTLGLWIPTPHIFDVDEGSDLPAPLRIAHAWGFPDYVGAFVWDKVLGMPGKVNHVVHENLFIFTRGGDRPDKPTPQPKSIFTIRRSDQHSEKPNADVRKMIERHWTRGPYLELFGREPVEGWTVFGNDAALWGEQAAEARTA